MLQRLEGYTLRTTPSAACGVSLWGRPAWRHRGLLSSGDTCVAEEIGAEHLDPIILLRQPMFCLWISSLLLVSL